MPRRDGEGWRDADRAANRTTKSRGYLEGDALLLPLSERAHQNLSLLYGGPSQTGSPCPGAKPDGRR